MSFSVFFFFSSRRRHTRSLCDWSSDVCSSDLGGRQRLVFGAAVVDGLCAQSLDAQLELVERHEIRGLVHFYAAPGSSDRTDARAQWTGGESDRLFSGWLASKNPEKNRRLTHENPSETVIS